MKLFLIPLFILIPLVNLLAQKINFEHLSAQDGLSQATVTCIDQDNTGFLWFGTYDGLNRYDREGEQFLHYRHNPEDTNSISHDDIQMLKIKTDAQICCLP